MQYISIKEKNQTVVFRKGAKRLTHIKEDHYVLANQPQGKYLTHFTVQTVVK